jgi:hypothetical protein
MGTLYLLMSSLAGLLTLAAFPVFGRWKKTATAPSPSSGSGLPSATVPERRQSRRRWGDPIQLQISDGRPDAPLLDGWVLNRSQGGVALSMAEPMAVGSFLSIRITTAADLMPWLLVEVKHQAPRAGRWLVGCKFVNPPPEEVLLLFR